MLIRNIMNASKKLTVILSVVAFVAGCATSQKVQVVQAGDTTLTKEQILCEIAKLEEAEKKVEKKKGVTGTNVAAALFFWPGLIATHMDANEATNLIIQRKSHLTNLYNQKLATEGRKSNSNSRKS